MVRYNACVAILEKKGKQREGAAKETLSLVENADKKFGTG